MNKKVKIMLIILGLIAFISIVFINAKSQYDANQNEKKEEEKQLKDSISNMNEINIDEFVELFNSEETKIILVASLTCPHCTALKPKLNKIVGKLKVEVNYLEISTLTEEDQEKFYSANLFMQENTAIPLVIAVKDNKVVDHFTGNIEENQIEEFLKKNLEVE